MTAYHYDKVWAPWQVSMPCNTCAPARGSIARFSIDLVVRSHGEYRDQQWQVCGMCLPSCFEAATRQHKGVDGPEVHLMPSSLLEYT